MFWLGSSLFSRKFSEPSLEHVELLRADAENRNSLRGFGFFRGLPGSLLKPFNEFSVRNSLIRIFIEQPFEAIKTLSMSG